VSTLDRPCDDWLERVSAHLDGEAGDAEDRAVREHLDACPGCRAWAEAMRTDAERFAAVYGRATQQVNLRLAVLDRIAASTRGWSPWDGVWQIAAVAAGVGLIAALLFPVLAGGKCRSMQTQCMSNQKQIMLAMIQYADDWDGHLPPAIAWNAYLTGYLQTKDEVFRCPVAQHQGSREYDYAYNPTMSAKSAYDLPEPAYAVTVFEAANGQVAPRHLGGANIAYADGHVKWSRPTQTPAGWVLKHGERSIPVPFGAQAVTPASYRITGRGVESTAYVLPAPAPRPRAPAWPFVAGAAALLLAGVLGWGLGRRRGVARGAR
jgi:prepilin-type processing-associated H-X9-DG protein